MADLIRERGYPSLENFALSNGMHKATVHQVVKGVVDPRLSTLIRLAEALEVPLERLVGGLGS
ncbi:MAG TPA: helix-turn-helix transcriptional regulator [Fibrobacteria bacterium]|nr:helix-turn-helix transcriptional regulator [Fibrobacteria bacterium]